MVAVRLRRVTKRYGEKVAVKDVSFSVEEGQFFGFIGPNGAGKTTTIDILTGQIMPSSGRCSVMGVSPVTEPVKVRRKVGILPEREDPPSFMTPREYLEFVGDVRNVSDIDERIEEWAERLRFSSKLDVMNRSLSKGEKQKVMVSQALIHSPRLAFIDEPLINLDPVIQEKLKNYLVDYVDEGNTIFLSTHVMSLADEVCTHIGVVDDGSLLEKGGIDTIKKDDDKLSEAFLRIVGE